MSELPPYLVGDELPKTVKRIVDSYSASSADKYYGEVKPIKMASDTSGTQAYGGFTLNIYKDLEGWGTHKGPTDLYTKDVMLNDYTIVRNAPFMTSAGILHQDK
jgi:hypothetical protein